MAEPDQQPEPADALVVEPVEVIDQHPDRGDFTTVLQEQMAIHGTVVRVRTGVLTDRDGAQPTIHWTLADSSVVRTVFMPERSQQAAGNKARAIAKIIRASFAGVGVEVHAAPPGRVPAPPHQRTPKRHKTGARRGNR